MSPYDVAFAAVVVITDQPVLPSALRSTTKPVSVFELSTHVKFICVEDTAVATKELGASGAAPVEYVSFISTAVALTAPVVPLNDVAADDHDETVDVVRYAEDVSVASCVWPIYSMPDGGVVSPVMSAATDA